MRNNLAFLIMLLVVSGKTLAQCPENTGTDDVLSIPVSIHLLPSHLQFELCQTVTLHNNATFVMDNDFNLGSNQTCWLDFGDGSPLVQVAEGASVSHTYALNISGADVFFPMKAIVKESGFADIHSAVSNLALKATYSVNNGGFTLPDEVWMISTSATFPPPVQGAFPPGSPYNGNAVSGAHAYLKFAPTHNGNYSSR
jgi:hypothetical protein